MPIALIAMSPTLIKRDTSLIEQTVVNYCQIIRRALLHNYYGLVEKGKNNGDEEHYDMGT